MLYLDTLCEQHNVTLGNNTTSSIGTSVIQFRRARFTVVVLLDPLLHPGSRPLALRPTLADCIGAAAELLDAVASELAAAQTC